MMGTATRLLVAVEPDFHVGAYSMNDGDCDRFLLPFRLLSSVGAYSMNDGDCDGILVFNLLLDACRSVFHE